MEACTRLMFYFLALSRAWARDRMNGFIQWGVTRVRPGPRMEGVSCYFELTTRAGTVFRKEEQASTGLSHCQLVCISETLWNLTEHQQVLEHWLFKFRTPHLKLYGCHQVIFYLCGPCLERHNKCLFDKYSVSEWLSAWMINAWERELISEVAPDNVSQRINSFNPMGSYWLLICKTSC